MQPNCHNDATLRRMTELAYALVGLAEVLLEQGESAEAHALVLEAMTIHQAALPAEHFGIVEAQRVLGECLTALGRYEEAEVQLLGTQSICERQFGAVHVRTITVTEALVELYAAWHEAEAGRGHDASAARWRAKSPVPGEPPEQPRP